MLHLILAGCGITCILSHSLIIAVIYFPLVVKYDIGNIINFDLDQVLLFVLRVL